MAERTCPSFTHW